MPPRPATMGWPRLARCAVGACGGGGANERGGEVADTADEGEHVAVVNHGRYGTPVVTPVVTAVVSG